MGTQFGYGTMMGGQQLARHGMLGFGGFGVFAFFAFLVLAAIIVAIVIWAVARKHGHSGTHTAPQAPTASAGDTALAIARERLARGEIDPEQYTAIVAALGGQLLNTPPAG